MGHALGEDQDTRESDPQFRGKDLTAQHPTGTAALQEPKPELSCVIYPTKSQLSTWPGIMTASGTNALSQLLGSMYNSLFLNEISVGEMC